MINDDWRRRVSGFIIPTEKGGYCDQPTLVKGKSGVWICSITTGSGGEGAKGQYVSITRSFDKGRTWTEPVAIEDTAWESAYSGLAVAPSGRIYCFYCHNLDHVDISEAKLPRYDMGGYYCYRYSEDDGLTWSERHLADIRDFVIDHEQQERFMEYNGKPLRFFWNVSRVFFEGDDVYSPIIKYEIRENDVLYRSEGTLIHGIGLDAHPDRCEWETLPDGDKGLRTPVGGGRVAEEQSYVRLSDGSLFVVYRTIDSHSVCCYSRDNGHTFTAPEYMQFADGRLVKHNRAANFIWPLGDGKYLYWFNNQGIRDYFYRNPVWCSIATEVQAEDGIRLSFGEPEILLYDENSHIGMSYPSMLIDDGIMYFTETQKLEARVHAVDTAFAEKLIHGIKTLPNSCAVWTKGEKTFALPKIEFTRLSHKTDDQTQVMQAGFTVSMKLKDVKCGDVLLKTSGNDGYVEIGTDKDGCAYARLEAVMAGCSVYGSKNLCDGKAHSLTLIVDNAAGILYFVTDGHMDDGGEKNISGWHWLNRSMQRITPEGFAACGSVEELKWYDGALLTNEVISASKY